MRRFVAASAGLAVGLVLTFMLAIATRPTAAPEVSAPSDEQPLAAAAAQQAAPPSSGVPSEGIKVHGHWVIQVHDPDGTLVSWVEFDNALVGGAHLSALLARTSSVGKWQVELKSSEAIAGPDAEIQPCGSTTTSLAGISITFRHPCVIAEAGSGIAAHPSVFETLTVAAPAAGQPNAGALVLSGTATARANASIKLVKTILAPCDAATAPATSCAFVAGGGFVPLTATTLAMPVAVANGQQIQVTVVISFQ